MKKLILTVALGVACVSAFAQGTFNFATAAPGAVAKVTSTDGTALAGASWQADLFWAPSGTSDSSLFVALGAPAGFNTGGQAGYFTGGSRTVSTVAGGSSIAAQVRVWNVANGANYTAASTVAGALIGESAIFSLGLTTAPATPGNMTGINGKNFSLYAVQVPEPTTMALAGLGAAALLIFRRRK